MTKHMYPLNLDPNHIRFQGKRGRAEYEFYYTLQDKLSDEWKVMWGRDLQSPAPVDGSSEGEADFILIHPLYGIFVLEVKGGGLEYRPDDHVWVSWGRESEYELSTSPFAQVKRTCRLLRKIFQTDPTSPSYFRSRHFTICWAVVFNQCRLIGDLPSDLREELLIDERYLDIVEFRLQNHIHQYFFNEAFERVISDDLRQEPSRRRYDHSYGIYDNRVREDIRFRTMSIDEEGWNYLRKKFLAAELSVKAPSLATQIKHEAEKLRLLTDEQYRVIETLESKDYLQAKVKGCSGSGKTLCAIELAKRFARKKKYVLLLCYNPALEDWLARETAQNSHYIRTSTIHSFCRSEVSDLPNAYDLPSYRRTEVLDYEWPLILLEQLKTVERRYDVIIVDEAQDYRGLWWEVIPELRRDDNSRFYVFYDENQILYADSAINDIPIHTPALTLRRNCRNTQHIHKFISAFYHDEDEIICQGPEGDLPKLFVYRDDDQQKDGVRRLLARWGEGFKEQDTQPFHRMVTLTLHGRTGTFLANTPKLGNVNIVERPNRWSDAEAAVRKPYTVLWSTDRRFKGLESDAIVLVDIDQQNEDAFADELLYVGGSRAKHRLYGFVHERALSWLKPRVANLATFYEDINVLSSLDL